MSDGWRTRNRWFDVCIGLLLGTLTVSSAALLGTRDDGWRIDIYFAVTAVTGVYLGWTSTRDRRQLGKAISAGQVIASVAWVWPVIQESGEGFALMWPVFVVPIGLGFMVVIAALAARLRTLRGE